ncbi:hypothetical protein MGM1_3360 [Candidatus Malacoplasma girerdii]|uniref:Uncharacterized protein n=1 Tax=Candidatus Malacoplasma girerdii TaxID=1318617 RepID=A0A097SSZ3_9BACT|nr:hypothetical protein MGM1_3360 [Candidatus Malacoplasma girerdii]ASJ89233.1 MAG: hypothetical protein B1217_0341 [Candidatus Malacoplasma girerdii]
MQNENKKDNFQAANNEIKNKNIAIKPEELKKLNRKRLIILAVLGLIDLICLIAMILVLTLIHINS